MKQNPLDLNLHTRKTRERVFLQQMETVAGGWLGLQFCSASQGPQ